MSSITHDQVDLSYKQAFAIYRYDSNLKVTNEKYLEDILYLVLFFLQNPDSSSQQFILVKSADQRHMLEGDPYLVETFQSETLYWRQWVML